MRNLINLLWKYHFGLLFLFLEILSLGIFLSFNSFQGTNFLGFTNELSGTLHQNYNSLSAYFSLKEINRDLAAENAELREKLKSSYHSLLSNRVYFGDTLYEQQYEFISAKIINSSTNKRSNYILVNKGARHGIEPDMGVISGRGVVGVVKSVSRNYSLISSVLHSRIKISAQLASSKHFGLVTWSGQSPQLAELNDIPKHVNIKKGEKVETRGSSTYFPPGISIGSVLGLKETQDPAFHEIQIQLSHDFTRSAFVYIVKNQLKEEQLNIENQESSEQ